MTPKNHYAHRDHLKQGQAFMDHMYALTDEDLRSKSEIAAELAHRDLVISNLQAREAKMREWIKACRDHVLYALSIRDDVNLDLTTLSATAEGLGQLSVELLEGDTNEAVKAG